MTTLSSFIFYVFLMLETTKVKSDTTKNGQNNVFESKTFHSDNGIMGVASVAEVTSRNGRVSSVGGIKFFPADSNMNKDPNGWIFTKIYDFPTADSKMNKDSKNDFQWTSKPNLNRNGDAKVNGAWTFTKNTGFPATNSKTHDNPKPWTFTTKSENGFAMGAVHSYPGSVAVSAVNIMDKPSGNVARPSDNFAPLNPFINWPHQDFHPRSSFYSHSDLNSMFPKNVFKSFNPPRQDFGNPWLFPNYDPFFNVWQ